MEVVSSGIDLTTGAAAAQPIDEQQFGQFILGSLKQYFTTMTAQSTRAQTASNFKGEVERQRSADLGNPREAGWTYLINPSQAGIGEFKKALLPLAKERGMVNPNVPLAFQHESEEDWEEWLQKNYYSIQDGHPPHYIMIVGGPDQVPFGFQSLLNSTAAVGRVDFDTPDELKCYIEKLIRLELAETPGNSREALFFAPNHGMRDPTFYSCQYMAQPLADYVTQAYQMEVKRLFNDQATKRGLLSALKDSRPALLYSASHGAVAPQEDINVQKQFYGAICCQAATADEKPKERMIAAEDIPGDAPFLEGAVVFQFACFGYGNPAKSDFELWLGKPQMNARLDFVSALPKKLLSHPRGPIAYIGHIDAAWMHGFLDDPHHPAISEHWQRRIEPFQKAICSLLEVQPVGLAMGAMNRRYDLENFQILNSYMKVMRGDKQVTPEYHKWLTDTFILRSDAQNYMVFGDPAAHLRITNA
jgi:hypothetical protein